MPKNHIINKAKITKNDEFYTLYKDIEKELEYYGEQFRNKRIICPCDDKEGPRSNFYRYLVNNKERFGIKSIDTSGWLSTLSEEENLKLGNKKFQDVDYSKYDILITNPPFTLFRELFETISKFPHLKFLVLGNINAISFKPIFSFIKENKVWIGYTGFVRYFNKLKEDGTTSYELGGSSCWWTNLYVKPKPFLNFNPKTETMVYERYDEFPNMIEVNKSRLIPKFNGKMGVPVTFFVHINTNQFKIHEIRGFLLNGKHTYKRMVIELIK